MGDHAVVGANGEPFDVPTAYECLGRLGSSESAVVPNRFDRARHLCHGRDVGDHDATGCEDLAHRSWQAPMTLDETGGLVGVKVAAPIPEPETYALMMAGLGVVGFMARRRRKV